MHREQTEKNSFLETFFLGERLFDRYLFLFLIGTELLMSFSFLGFIHTPPISVTFAYFPIIVSGLLLKMPQTLIISLFFGFASLFKATPYYVMISDAVFSPFSSNAPVNSIFLSLGTRLIFGALVSYCFSRAINKKFEYLWIGLVACFSPKLHSIIVLTALGMLFPEFDLNHASSLNWDDNDTLTALGSIFVCMGLWYAVNTDKFQFLKHAINHASQNPYKSKFFFFALTIFIFLLIALAISAALYFIDREAYMLRQYQILITPVISRDLFYLQCQFVFAMVGIMLLSTTVLFSYHQYMSYKEYQDGIDTLTNVMGRKMFFFCCHKLEEKSKSAQNAASNWFLFVDIDYFKVINDTFGHAAGDKVLHEIAQNLSAAFKETGYIGRIGGDEFAVIIYKQMSEEELGCHLSKFLANISSLLPQAEVSCSIGGYEFVFPQKLSHILSMADTMLYKAKENGRACYKLQPIQSSPSPEK